ncbi:MAG: hypothetical protein U5K51_07040 [Flavobacteriaceae bacterium]|nr:hypothetical protein [Flavobacteriaceae bacterium]
MKSKWTLFAGILFLVAGIVLRNLTEYGLVPVSLMVLGVLFKTYYIVGMAKSGQYKPGYELYFLFAGLGLFLTGLDLKLLHPFWSFHISHHNRLVAENSFYCNFYTQDKGNEKTKIGMLPNLPDS